MFGFLIDTLEKNGKGVGAYRLCSEQAHKAVATMPGCDTPLLLLATVAESFVQLNERMPITAEDIETAFARFQDHVQRLSSAYENGTADQKLAALDHVAASQIQAGA